MSCSIISLFALGALSLSTFGLGRLLLRWIGVDDGEELSVVTFSIGLGLMASGVILLVLGMVGVLFLPLIALLTMVCSCWGLVEIGISCLRAKSRLPDIPIGQTEEEKSDSISGWPAPPRWLLIGVSTAAAIVCGASLLGALTPPTTGATLSCQLESAKRFLVDHGIAELPTSDGTVRPLLADMWYLWALVFEGGICTQLVHWGMGLLLALATVTLATPLLGRSWAWLAGGLVVLTPAVNQQMSLPTESVALAAFSTLALAAWWQAAIHGASFRWFVVAGLIAGGALGVHHSAALLLPAVGITWVWADMHQAEQRRFLLQGGLVATLIAIGIGGLCNLPAIWLPARATGQALAAVLPHHLGAVLLAAAPGVLLARRLRGLGAVLSVAVVYGVLAFWLTGGPRLMLPAVPLLSVAAVWVWIELRRFPQSARRTAFAAFAVALVSNVVVSTVRPSDALAVAVGLEDREEYLLRHEPTYPAAAVANRLLRSGAHILSQDPQTFYFDCRVTCQDSLGHMINLEKSDSSSQETIHKLRRAGFTHLLLAETMPCGSNDADEGDSLFSQSEDGPVCDENRRADVSLPLTDYCFRTADGSVRHYRLLLLR